MDCRGYGAKPPVSIALIWAIMRSTCPTVRRAESSWPSSQMRVSLSRLAELTS
jgi:hypothetical protein